MKAEDLTRIEVASIHHRSVMMINTVDENKSKYTKRQVERADVDRKLYGIVGYPSLTDFITNCPVTLDDVKTAELIYGPSIDALKGKTRRQKPIQVKTDYVDLPKEVMMNRT
jgi:hypothetical protein